jgi:hypothetical protein
MKENLKFMFKTNQVILKRLLEDIGDKETLDCAGGLCNPIRWQAGHLAWSTDLVAWLLDGRKSLPENWIGLFEYGCGAPDENTVFPPFAEIREKLYELQAKTNGLLEVFDEKKFADEVELTENWRMNRLDAILFFGKHDSYHAGQITILRKSLGLQ